MTYAPAPKFALVLGLEYYNFKFNYRQIHGVQMLWAGPVITPLAHLGLPQVLRQARWSLFHDRNRLVQDAGWHFSFLTATDDVRPKLDTMFIPREKEWRGFRDGARSDRRDSVTELIRARRGFHDHMYAGSVWAHVPISDLRCERLERLVEAWPGYLLHGPADPAVDVREKAALAMWRLYDEEIPKVLNNATGRQVLSEIVSRLMTRARRFVPRG
jgi:hypothetical protein